MIETVTLFKELIKDHNFPINHNQQNLAKLPLSSRTDIMSPISFTRDLVFFFSNFNISDKPYFSKKDMFHILN